MPSAVQLVGRLERQLGPVLSAERCTSASRNAAVETLDALAPVLEREPAGPFSNELTR